MPRCEIANESALTITFVRMVWKPITTCVGTIIERNGTLTFYWPLLYKLQALMHVYHLGRVHIILTETHTASTNTHMEAGIIHLHTGRVYWHFNTGLLMHFNIKLTGAVAIFLLWLWWLDHTPCNKCTQFYLHRYWINGDCILTKRTQVYSPQHWMAPQHGCMYGETLST